MKFLNKKLITILFILLVISIAAYLVCQYQKQKPEENTIADLHNNGQNLNSTSTLKTYRNEEWSFEFQYPKDWIVEENYTKGYYSKFNLRVIPINEKHTKIPVVINIVLPEFAETSFRGINKATSKIIINGIYGVEYKYKYKGRDEIAAILPFGNLRIIIGTDDKQCYENIFNQVIDTFKFLKQDSNPVKIIP